MWAVSALSEPGCCPSPGPASSPPLPKALPFCSAGTLLSPRDPTRLALTWRPPPAPGIALRLELRLEESKPRPRAACGQPDPSAPPPSREGAPFPLRGAVRAPRALRHTSVPRGWKPVLGPAPSVPSSALAVVLPSMFHLGLEAFARPPPRLRGQDSLLQNSQNVHTIYVFSEAAMGELTP